MKKSNKLQQIYLFITTFHTLHCVYYTKSELDDRIGIFAKVGIN